MSLTVQQSTVRKLLITGPTITGIPGIDPVTAYVEDLGPMQGSLTLTCFGKAWTAWWGAASEHGIAHFILAVSVDYLVNCLDRGIESQVYDPDEARAIGLRRVLRQRRARQLSQQDAYDEYWAIESLHMEDDPWQQPKDMNLLLGDEWPSLLPMVPNPDYVYLSKIVEATRAALATLPENQRLQEASHA